jgi:hypothetical protein
VEAFPCTHRASGRRRKKLFIADREEEDRVDFYEIVKVKKKKVAKNYYALFFF